MEGLERIDTQRLSPQSRWALEHLALPKHEDDVDDQELARRHELQPRVVKRMLDDLYGEIRAQQKGAVLPELGKRERETLREQLQRHGQLVPVIRDQHGNTIDGHNREELLLELGLEVKYETIVVDGEEDARQKGLAVNLTRRHLDARRLRRIASAEILHDPARSDRAIAEQLGVSHPTVARARKELLKLGMVVQRSTTVGKNGVVQPATKPTRQPDAHAREALVGARITEYVVDVEAGGRERTIVVLDNGRRYELLELEEAS